MTEGSGREMNHRIHGTHRNIEFVILSDANNPSSEELQRSAWILRFAQNDGLLKIIRDHPCYPREKPSGYTRKIAPSFFPRRMVIPVIVMPRKAMAQTPRAEAMNLPSPSNWKSS